MKLSDAIRKRIKYYLKIQDMNIWDLCKATGIPCSTISTFMSGKTELIKLDTILHICEGFNISLGEFFTDSIFDNTYQESNKD
ncbi:transcriptional regulator Cro/CI family [Clostridium sp. CAG:921]|nr:transcriptional regulator Cro/CI family [Clostridium sp. CAG:921]